MPTSPAISKQKNTVVQTVKKGAAINQQKSSPQKSKQDAHFDKREKAPPV